MTGTSLRGAPRSVVAVAAAAVLLLALPVLALVQRAPWSGLSSLLTRREVVDAPSSFTVAANAGRSARSSKSGKRRAVCDVIVLDFVGEGWAPFEGCES